MPRKKVVPVSKLASTDKRLKANRKPKNIPMTSNGAETLDGENHLESVYCRRCMENKKVSAFFKATDLLIDRNTYMSICKDCVVDLYSRYYQIEHDIDRAMLRLCRVVNWAYTEKAIESTKKQFASGGKSPDDLSFPGIYRGKLAIRGEAGFTKDKATDSSELIFREPFSQGQPEAISDDAFGEDTIDLKTFWGTNFTYDQFIFLEAELSRWKASHLSDTYAQISLLKELCYKELEIRNARVEGNSTSSLIREKQDLMKTCSVDPAKANLASSGQNRESFGLIIKQIEETEPADFYKDKTLFKDFDNISFYFEKYVRRPLKNFVTGSRDFNVDATDDSDDEYDDYDKYNQSGDDSKEELDNGGKN